MLITWATIYLTFIFVSRGYAVIQDVDVKCTEQFCEEYLQKHSCPRANSLCQNKTRSVILPSPSTCNCCERCFEFLEMGNNCIEGGPGVPLPNVICEPGTECTEGICKKKTTPDVNFYRGYECDEKECFCAVIVDDKPQKIFGRFPKSAVNGTRKKQCECSIFAYQAQETVKQIVSFPDIQFPVPRCLPNGQFDSLQCADDMCGCVDPETGNWDASTRKVAIGTLSPGNPHCFDSKRHKPGEYYTICETERKDVMNEILWSEMEDLDIILSHKVECTPDGRYNSEYLNVLQVI